MSREYSLSVDAKGLVKAFESAPEKTKDEVRNQMKIAAARIKRYGQKHHRYISRSGNLERDGINTMVNGAEAVLWLDTKAVPYSVAIHEGRPAMVIVPREKKLLRWVWRGGFVSKKRVQIPVLKPDPFLYEAVEHELPGIEQDFAQALQKVLEEL